MGEYLKGFVKIEGEPHTTQRGQHPQGFTGRGACMFGR